MNAISKLSTLSAFQESRDNPSQLVVGEFVTISLIKCDINVSLSAGNPREPNEILGRFSIPLKAVLETPDGETVRNPNLDIKLANRITLLGGLENLVKFTGYTNGEPQFKIISDNLDGKGSLVDVLKRVADYVVQPINRQRAQPDLSVRKSRTQRARESLRAREFKACP